MGPFRLAKGALACFLGIAALVAADTNAGCTKTVQAQQGDTCATIASAAGITVAQFLISNPSVTSCSQLQVGATYCLAGVAATTIAPTTPSTSTVAPPASSSTGPLKVSTDGTCGSGVTCAGSTFGSCCSEHGYCGSTVDYCTTGCQAGFGSCGTGAVSSSSVSAPITTTTSACPVGSAASTTVTVSVTTTAVIAITRTSIVLTTSTNVVPATTTQTVSSTVLLTSTVTRTATATAIPSTVLETSTLTLTTISTQTVKSTVLATSIVTLTTTSLVLATSTATSTKTASTTITNTAQVTSVVLETLTTIKTLTITSVNTVGCVSGPSFVTTLKPTTTTIGRPSIVTSTTTPTPAYPSPILPGTIDTCVSYDQIQSSDTCRTIATRNDITLRNFYKYNPTVSLTAGLLPTLCTPGLLDLLLSGLCQIDCENLWPGYFVCVGV
ncbi:hypothetical protein B0T19DRAFT_443926 [Cercophora scortea]|uniref:Carbohydrate-binding module family 18 protein n=1 Tax=Cercophora scortea TaxID=314031 RepID=A0AAE0MA21_9PEZI|nr:hypothetical protein B0T19DRAFT_443926 [Cercophora scortea]